MEKSGGRMIGALLIFLGLLIVAAVLDYKGER